MPKIKYSESLKLEVIRYVLSGNSMRSASHHFVVEYMRSKGLSARQASAYFNIPSFRSVIVWERKYISEWALSLFKETRGKGNFQTGSIKGRKPKAVELV